jgi:hypothetical protein
MGINGTIVRSNPGTGADPGGGHGCRSARVHAAVADWPFPGVPHAERSSGHELATERPGAPTGSRHRRLEPDLRAAERRGGGGLGGRCSLTRTTFTGKEQP